MAKDRTKDLTQGTPWKVIAGFSLPVIGGNLFQLFYTLADSMIVGRTLGADALAAVGGDGDDRIFCAVLHSGTDRWMWNFTGTGIRRGK